MSAAVWGFVGATLSCTAILVPLFTWRIVRRCKSRWVLEGQRQAELTHPGWLPAVSGEFHNRLDGAVRRRSPDFQLVTRGPVRGVAQVLRADR